VRDLTSRDPVFVLVSHGQLEQVFLNLLVHASSRWREAEQKTITVRSSLLAKRLLVEISSARRRSCANRRRPRPFWSHPQRDRRTRGRSAAD